MTCSERKNDEGSLLAGDHGCAGAWLLVGGAGYLLRNEIRRIVTCLWLTAIHIHHSENDNPDGVHEMPIEG